MNPPTGPRPCERQCDECGLWKHYSRFRPWPDSTRNGGRRFAAKCKACENKLRNQHKNEDRPAAIMKRRCASHARKAGESFDFLWFNMNWRALVPVFRAMMTDEGLCTSCGHKFDN